MSKKQIEEMARDICECFNNDGTCYQDDKLCDCKCDSFTDAQYLYEKGYRKQSEGKWILTGTFKSIFPLPVANLHKACSVCRWSPPKYSDDYKEYKFCPNCGAKMKGGAE